MADEINSFGFEDLSPILKRFSLNDPQEVEAYVYAFPRVDNIKPFIMTECHWNEATHKFVKCLPDSTPCCNSLGKRIKRYGGIILRYHPRPDGSYSFALYPWIMGKKQFEAIVPVINCDFKLRVLEHTGGSLYYKTALPIPNGFCLWETGHAEIKEDVKHFYPTVHEEMIKMLTFKSYLDNEIPAPLPYAQPTAYVNNNNDYITPIPTPYVSGGILDDFFNAEPEKEPPVKKPKKKPKEESKPKESDMTPIVNKRKIEW